MLALPPVAPVVGLAASTRLPRDHYVRIDSNDYSVHPSVVGRRVEVVADLTRVTRDLRRGLVADHERGWASAPEHHRPRALAAAALMRATRQHCPAPASLTRASLVRSSSDRSVTTTRCSG